MKIITISSCKDIIIAIDHSLENHSVIDMQRDTIWSLFRQDLKERLINETDDDRHLIKIQQLLFDRVLIDRFLTYFYPNGLLTYSEFEQLFHYLLFGLDYIEKYKLNDIPCSLLQAPQALFDTICKWENLTDNEEILDIIQLYCNNIMNNDHKIIINAKRLKYQEFKNKLAGRNPTNEEMKEFHQVIQKMYEIGRLREAGAYCHLMGLSHDRMKKIMMKYSQNNKEIEILVQDWMKYFDSDLYRVKINKLLFEDDV